MWRGKRSITPNPWEIDLQIYGLETGQAKCPWFVHQNRRKSEKEVRTEYSLSAPARTGVRIRTVIHSENNHFLLSERMFIPTWMDSQMKQRVRNSQLGKGENSRKKILTAAYLDEAFLVIHWKVFENHRAVQLERYSATKQSYRQLLHASIIIALWWRLFSKVQEVYVGPLNPNKQYLKILWFRRIRPKSRKLGINGDFYFPRSG